MKAFDIVQSNDKYVYSQIPLTSVASSLNNYTNAYGLPEGSNHPKVGAVIYNGTDSFNGGVDLKDTPTLLDTGTTYSYLSKDQVESIVGLYGNVTYNDAGKAYEVPCWVGNPGNYLEFNFKMNNTLKYQHLNLLFQSVLMLVVLNCVYLVFYQVLIQFW